MFVWFNQSLYCGDLLLNQKNIYLKTILFY
jgi:hypothetical protein